MQKPQRKPSAHRPQGTQQTSRRAPPYNKGSANMIHVFDTTWYFITVVVTCIVLYKLY